MRPLTITRAVQIDLAIHTGAITRSRRDYYTHPVSSCRWDDCDALAADDEWCDDHAGLANTYAADRMRKVRATAFERRVAHAAASARYREKRKSA